MIHEQERRNGNAVGVLGQVLTNRRQAIEALDAAVGESPEGAIKDGVGAEEAENPVQHDGGVRVSGGELRRELGRGDGGSRPGFSHELQKVQFYGGF